MCGLPTLIIVPGGLRGSGTREVRVDVVAIDGRRIRMLPAGAHEVGEVGEVSWDGRDEDRHAVANGVYFLQLLFDGRAVTSTRLVMVR
jgi:hypothetical protein